MKREGPNSAKPGAPLSDELLWVEPVKQKENDTDYVISDELLRILPLVPFRFDLIKPITNLVDS